MDWMWFGAGVCCTRRLRTGSSSLSCLCSCWPTGGGVDGDGLVSVASGPDRGRHPGNRGGDGGEDRVGVVDTRPPTVWAGLLKKARWRVRERKRA